MFGLVYKVQVEAKHIFVSFQFIALCTSIQVVLDKEQTFIKGKKEISIQTQKRIKYVYV